MNMKKQYAILAAAGMLMASAYKYFDVGSPNTNAVPISQPKYSLPRWDIGGHIIFAKDEKTAEKYAKKRGLWVPGTIVKSIESK